jgi:hypothetical protein
MGGYTIPGKKVRAIADPAFLAFHLTYFGFLRREDAVAGFPFTSRYLSTNSELGCYDITCVAGMWGLGTI